MPALSAPGDTRGISDPQFRWIYLGLLVIGTLLAIYLRRSGSGPDPANRMPTPSEAALLAEGPDRAVYAAVAGLRAAGAIGPGAGGQLACTGPLPPTRPGWTAQSSRRRGVGCRCGRCRAIRSWRPRSPRSARVRRPLAGCSTRPDAAALASVAIYGTAAIWAADPSFADATGLPGPSDSGSTSTGGDGGWGDGGGGGGGCGGGGG